MEKRNEPITFPTATLPGTTGDGDMVSGRGASKNVVIFGPPGVGKGEQAEILARRFSLPHLSTGEVLREEIKRGTELGKKVQRAVESGKFADDKSVIGIIASRIDLPEFQRGFVMDGFPRNLRQAKMLDTMLAERNRTIDYALFICAPEEVILERLTGRLVCEKCEATYHEKFKRPKVDGVCDRCGGAVSRRSDDDPETHRQRLQTYDEQTRPLESLYEQKGTLVRIDGNQSIEDVADEVTDALSAGPDEGE